MPSILMSNIGEIMNIEDVRKCQEQAGCSEIQDWIDNGTAWLLEGTVGRHAMDLLRSGACMLPEVRHRDYWGSTVPSRNDVKEGSTGSLQNCIDYWSIHEFDMETSAT